MTFHADAVVPLVEVPTAPEHYRTLATRPFETLAEAYDGQVAGVLLSGMGRDGTEYVIGWLPLFSSTSVNTT